MDWNLFWTAFGAIGGTVGALATAAAVIVALWQTKYNFKKKVKVRFTDNAMAINDTLKQKLICVEVINIGNRDIIVQNWGIKTKKREYCIFTGAATNPFFRNLNKQLPYTVRIEELFSLYYPFDLFKKQANDLIETKEINPLDKVSFYFHDSTGKEYIVKTSKTAQQYVSE